ncbi:hypothetical protein WANA31_0946 [Wolbachia endosymbiont of Drosophila ananassae]|nr:hypothetical protein WANA31_0946 [Wolbachia endosymbiont of Drosophila ananassae]RLT63301.1 hypothetical protein WANA34_0986 [Wolbachia endosymbiont of Drosophila ananassae]
MLLCYCIQTFIGNRNEKTYLTPFASPLIMKLKLFIYLLCTD